MNAAEQKELLSTNRAKGREPLASYLAGVPGMTWNYAMACLRVAPRRRRVNLETAGRGTALRLLGKR